MKKIIYSLLAMLMVACGVECSAQTVSGSKDVHDYVDLGLPSGRLWATCNVGANKVTEYGGFFAWGETHFESNHLFVCDFYKWGECHYDRCGWSMTLTKYCVNRDQGIVDSLTTLLAEDDAATTNWGKCWRMPTKSEQQELIDGCSWDWTNDFNGSGVAGAIGTSKINGNIIFLPASGYYNEEENNFVGDCGFYWSSSLSESSGKDFEAYRIRFTCSNKFICWDARYRFLGQSVRAVVN